jgi:hypothetical protein
LPESEPERRFAKLAREREEIERDLLSDTSVAADVRAKILSADFHVDHEKKTVVFTRHDLQDLLALSKDATPLRLELDLPPSLPVPALLEECIRLVSESGGEGSPSTIGEAAKARLAEIAEKAGLAEITDSTRAITLPGPQKFTSLPRSTWQFAPSETSDGGWRFSGVFTPSEHCFTTQYTF